MWCGRLSVLRVRRIRAPPSTAQGKAEQRKVPVPPHRMTPLKENWMKIYQPVVEFMHLQIRMNLASKSVEIRTSEVSL